MPRFRLQHAVGHCESWIVVSIVIAIALGIVATTMSGVLTSSAPTIGESTTCSSALSEDCFPLDMTLRNLMVANLTLVNATTLNLSVGNQTVIYTDLLHLSGPLVCEINASINPNCLPPLTFTVSYEGTSLNTSVTSLNFVGSGVNATNIGSAVTITVPSGQLTVQDEGNMTSATVTTFNFVGPGVTASGAGDTTTVTIAGSVASQSVTYLSAPDLSTGPLNSGACNLSIFGTVYGTLGIEDITIGLTTTGLGAVNARWVAALPAAALGDMFFTFVSAESTANSGVMRVRINIDAAGTVDCFGTSITAGQYYFSVSRTHAAP